MIKILETFKKVLDFFIIYKNDHIKYSQDGLWSTSFTYFMEDKKFLEAYKKGRDLMPETWSKDLHFHWRAYINCWIANNVKNIPGDYIECGTNTGMYARMIADYIEIDTTDKNMYLIDTYEGLSESYSSEREMERSKQMGYHKENIFEKVNQTFSEFKNIEVVKGVVPDILKRFDNNKFCYVSIDMNSVYPEVSALEYFWDKISIGGVVILDDHALDEKQGLAHIKFAKSKNSSILCLPTGQGLIIKNEI